MVNISSTQRREERTEYEVCLVAGVHLEPGHRQLGGDVEGGRQLLPGVLQPGLEVLLLETRGEWWR